MNKLHAGEALFHGSFTRFEEAKGLSELADQTWGIGEWVTLAHYKSCLLCDGLYLGWCEESE